MRPIQIPDKRWDFHNPSSTGLGEFKQLGGAVCFLSFLLSLPFWWGHFDLKALLISSFLSPAILLALPRLLRSASFAYQGAPIISFNEQGFFARRWSYFGWINWRDVMAVKITSDHTGLRHCIEVQLTDQELSHLAFSDRLSRTLINGLERLFRTSAENQNWLIITGTCELTCSNGDFVTTIRQILSDAHVPSTWKQTFPNN